MSTLKTVNLKHESSSSNNIVLDSSGKVTVATKKLYCPGQIIQVVQGKVTTTASFTGTDFEDSGLNCTITPAYTTSDILVCYRIYLGSSSGNLRKTRLSRQIASGSFSAVSNAVAAEYSGNTQSTSQMNNVALDWLDDPSFSAGETVTYRVDIHSDSSTFYINRWGASDTALAASTITLYEIAK